MRWSFGSISHVFEYLLPVRADAADNVLQEPFGDDHKLGAVLFQVPAGDRYFHCFPVGAKYYL